MKLGTFTKASVDNIRFLVDYSEWLIPPEILSASEFGSDPVGLIISGASINNSTELSFFVAGGTDGEVHNLLVTINTDGGQVRQDYIVVSVHNP